MNILVCISSVPDTTTKINFTENNTSLNTAGVQFIINPNDEFGLTKALQLKEANPGSKVTVIHVGPATNDPVIRKSLAIGADDAVRINTEAIDALQVSGEIANYIKSNPYDLIITGKESIDYNGAIVPHALGEMLGIPSISPCLGLSIDGQEAKLIGSVDGGKEEFTVALPVVAGGQKGMVEENELRIPNMRGIMQARTKPLLVVDAIGSKKAQKVLEYDSPAPKEACKMVDSNNMEELVKLLQNEAKVI
jgi:electron transfer flavoprotein beta subunit